MSAHELTSLENTYCQAQVHVSREVDQYVIFSFKHVYETIELVSNKRDTTGQYQTLSKLPRETFGIPRKYSVHILYKNSQKHAVNVQNEYNGLQFYLS